MCPIVYHRVRSLRQFLFLTLLFGCFSFDSGLHASEEKEALAIEQQVIAEDGNAKIFQPRDLTNTVYDGKRSDSSMAWSVGLFLFMFVVIVGFWIYTKKGGTGLKQFAATNDLKIRETKPLGNRQFLVVVEYGEQRMLLGVAPGVINHLCYLEAPENRSEVE